MKRSLTALVVVALLALAVWLLMSPPGDDASRDVPPDPDSASPDDIHAFVASERFVKWQHERRADYMQRLWEQSPERLAALVQLDGLSAKERRRLERNVGRGFLSLMLRCARECQALPEDARDAYLDDKLDEMLAKRDVLAAHARRRGDDPTRFGPPWARPDITPERMSRMVERMLSETTPEERAVLEEYRRRAMRRIIQRQMRSTLRRLGLTR